MTNNPTKPFASLRHLALKLQMMLLALMASSLILSAQIDCTNIPVWDPNEVYAAGGTRVQYEGKVYENKWWTQGDNPAQSGEWGVWRYIDDCITGNQLPEVNITAPSNSAVFYLNEQVTVTANAIDHDGTISQVEFFDGATSIGIVAATPYSISYNPITLGTHTLTAVATDNENASTTSDPVTYTLSDGFPVVYMTHPSEGQQIPQGDYIDICAMAQDANGSIASVEFFLDGISMGVDFDYPYCATTPSPALTPGNYCFSAMATDNSGNTTTSDPVCITIIAPNEAPVVSMTSPADNSTFEYGQAIPVAANASDPDGSIDLVIFSVDGTVIFNDEVAPYEYSWTGVAAGTYAVKAYAVDNQGKGTHSNTVNVTVLPNQGGCPSPQYVAGTTYGQDETVKNVQKEYSCDVPGWCSSASAWAYEPGVGAHWQMAWTEIGPCPDGPIPPTVSITSPQDGYQTGTGTNILINADATDSDGTVTQVEFFVNGTLHSTDNQSPFSAVLVQPAAGNYTVTAKATDNDLATATSAPITISVIAGLNIPPTVSMGSPYNGAVREVNSLISVTASAADQDGTVSKVEFYANGNLIGTATTPAAPYSIDWTPTVAGEYALTAVATDNENASTTSEANIVTITPVINGELPARIMSGYWHTWGGGPAGGVPFVKLRDVHPSWDVINISFAEPVVPGSTDGRMQFIVHGLTADYTITDFKADIQTLQMQGKSIVLSIGGYEGYFSLTSTAAINQFVSDIKSFIDEYGFDGIDIDLEQSSLQMEYGDVDLNNPTSPKLVNMISAIRQICDSYGPNFILSFAPEAYYMQMGYQWYAGVHAGVDRRAGSYIPVIHALRDKVTYVQSQLYNQPQIMALDGKLYSSGTVEYLVGLTEMMMTGFDCGQDPSIHFPGLRPDQVVIAVPASQGSAGSGHVTNAQIAQAFDYLTQGIAAGSYVTQGTYPSLRGIMAWSINWDAFQNNNSFVIGNDQYLNGLPPIVKAADDMSMVEESSIPELAVGFYPNPVSQKANFSVELYKAQKVRIEVFNTLGVQVAVVENSLLEAGKHLIEFDASALKEGMYIYRIQKGNEVVSNSFIKQ